MRSRSAAAMLSAGLLLILVLALTVVPVPYTLYSPGPTVNLLAKESTGQVVRISGHRTYPDTKGALRLLTVVPTGPDDHVALTAVVWGWLSPQKAVFRYDDIYQPQETNDEADAESQVEMVSSQDTAVAAALTQLGYRVPTSTQVLGVVRGGPGDGALEVHDQLLAVNGTRVTSTRSVVDQVQKVRPGSTVTLEIRRRGKVENLSVKTVKSADDPRRSALKISVGEGYDFPFKVNLKLDGNIGGPSAGMMFAVTIYDTLTPGSLTRGKDIAGTGEISASGKVGGIGGIQQKLAAAQAAGAQLFLAPAQNCDEVRGGPYDEHRMRVVKVTTLKQAISDIKAWTANPDTKLPTC